MATRWACDELKLHSKDFIQVQFSNTLNEKSVTGNFDEVVSEAKQLIGRFSK